MEEKGAIKIMKGEDAIEEMEYVIEIMEDKGVYVEKKGRIAYYIGSFKDDDGTVKIDGNAELTCIEKSAFAHSGVEKILLTGCSPNIGEKAFEDCGELNAVIFGELGKDDPAGNLRNLKLSDVERDFTIQAGAFKGCSGLATLVLPKVPKEHTLVIEKDAFFGCESLRTVVAICGKIAFTGNPFDGCSDHLTFVCEENSEVERFARENGYRSVCV